MNARSFIVIALAGSVLMCFSVAGAFAGGKDVFKNKCGSCHSQGGEAPVFAPAKYASIQWERFFDRNKHKKYRDISFMIVGNELDEVKEYLKNHAADSDRPEAVGLGM